MNLLRLLLILLAFPCYISIGRANSVVPGKTDILILIDTTTLFPNTVQASILTNSVDMSKWNTKDSVVIVKKSKSRKRIALILSFPLPFGALGLHRVFLGTKPYIPFAYLGTLGGCFGILPLIDFINILLSDKETYKNFENNPKVFMWVH